VKIEVSFNEQKTQAFVLVKPSRIARWFGACDRFVELVRADVGTSMWRSATTARALTEIANGRAIRRAMEARAFNVLPNAKTVTPSPNTRVSN
jgi:hypothetical protein